MSVPSSLVAIATPKSKQTMLTLLCVVIARRRRTSAWHVVKKQMDTQLDIHRTAARWGHALRSVVELPRQADLCHHHAEALAHQRLRQQTIFRCLENQHQHSSSQMLNPEIQSQQCHSLSQMFNRDRVLGLLSLLSNLIGPSLQSIHSCVDSIKIIRPRTHHGNPMRRNEARILHAIAGPNRWRPSSVEVNMDQENLVYFSNLPQKLAP
jgi:hypothetical protein